MFFNAIIASLLVAAAGFQITDQTADSVTVAGPERAAGGHYEMTAQDAGGFTAAWVVDPVFRIETIWRPADPVFNDGRVGVLLDDGSGFIMLHPGHEKRIQPKFEVNMSGAGLLKVEVYTRPATNEEYVEALTKLGVPFDAVQRPTSWFVRADDGSEQTYSESWEPLDEMFELDLMFDSAFDQAQYLTFLRTDYPRPGEFGKPIVVEQILAHYSVD